LVSFGQSTIPHGDIINVAKQAERRRGTAKTGKKRSYHQDTLLTGVLYD
jgi:hypothetical protein